MMLETRKGWKILSIFLAFALVFTTAVISTETVSATTVKPKAITLKTNAPKQVVDVKGKVNVSVKSVKPANASKSVTWKSSDKKIAAVNSKGVVTGKKAGKVKITATSKANKKIQKSITLTVKNIKPSSVKLSKTKATLYEKGKPLTLKASVNPVGVYNKGVTYSSSKKDVAAVSSKGVVTPKKAGTAVITVKTKENNKTAKCTVTVKKSKSEKVLMPYCMVGFYNKTKLNYTDVAADADVRVWDAASKTYKDGKNNEATILGNYVQLTDRDNDNKADLIEVVKFKDGAAKWDAGMEWIDGIGEDADPAVSDAVGKKMFVGADYRIPMGERLLTGWGLGDYSGTTDFSNLDKTTYWPDYDYYKTTSSDTLTMLTGYKTQLQTTGWTCVLSSALSVLEWYGERGDLNEQDLASLRSDTRSRRAGATSLKELENVFEKLGELKLTGEWVYESSLDSEDAYEKIYDPEWVKGHLAAGHPIMVIWNSYGGHGQVIIGYDDMGTKVTSDDVLIMMDPYDSTDHNANGYIIQSYERLAYGLSDEEADGISATRYMVAYPKNEKAYKPVMGEGIPNDNTNTWKSNDANKLNSKLYAQTAKDLAQYYPVATLPDYWIGPYNEKTGLGGPAGIERLAGANGDYNHSPYYKFYDYYNGQGPTKTLDILDNYGTIQQSTEWACGCTSATMVLEHFKKNANNETDMSLSHIRQKGETGPTFLSGMKEIFTKLNAKNSDDWVFFSSSDLKYNEEADASFIGDYCLEWGKSDGGLIPYLIEHNIPMMIGWDEWGGHWQTIIGYDDMGTPQSQDDVLILADSYDTTDHDQDGYVVESFERLVYGWNSQFELNTEAGGSGSDYTNFIVAFPKAGNEQVMEDLGLN